MSRPNKTEAFDLLGMALMDYQKGRHDTHIMVCSSLWEPQQTDINVFFRDFDEMPVWERQAMDKCRGRVLDVGAGAGAHGLFLQSRSLEVTALELAREACEVMKQRGVRDVKTADFFTFIDADGFDTILLLMNGAGIARTLQGLPALLQKCKSLLRPGGQILIDSTDIIYMYEEEDGSAWINLNATYYGEVDMWMEYNGLISTKTSWLYADPEILASTALECGLSCEIVFRDDGGQYLALLT